MRNLDDLYNELTGRVEVQIRTAAPLSEELCERVAGRLESVLGKRVNLAAETDEGVIGGIIVRVGDTVYDGSVAGRLGRLRDENGYTQVQLADSTGKSKGEISKILSLLDLDPEVQKMAREDSTGLVTRRHLYAVRQFPVDRQIKIIKGIQDGRYTAEAIDLIRETDQRNRSDNGRLQNWQRRTYRTRHASVSFRFRKPEVADQDVLQAMAEIKRQVAEDNAS